MLINIKLEKILKQKGYKLTQSRKILIDELIKYSGKSISVQELFVKLKDKGMDFSTIYRNMELLAKEDIVSTIRRVNGITSYELCFGEHHHHLVCTNCGAVSCINHCPLDFLQKEDLQGFIPKEHHFEILGICQACAIEIDK